MYINTGEAEIHRLPSAVDQKEGTAHPTVTVFFDEPEVANQTPWRLIPEIAERNAQSSPPASAAPSLVPEGSSSRARSSS